MYNETVCSSVPDIPVHIRGGKGKRGIASNNHFHKEIELLRVEKGKMQCSSNGIICEISEGETLFINSLVPHSTYILEDDTQSTLVQIDAEKFLNRTVSKYLSRYVNSGENQLYLFNADNNATKEIFIYIDNILKEFQSKSHAYEMYIKANIYNILALLYRNSVLINVDNLFDISMTNKILPVLKYIESNFSNHISLDDISCMVNLNESYFCRIFKKATNTTFTDYLNFVRICNAEKLLTSTEKSILEISLETGFSSISYFNRTFKKFKNCSPTDYKKIKYAQV